jgi:hypothetical protein
VGHLQSRDSTQRQSGRPRTSDPPDTKFHSRALGKSFARLVGGKPGGHGAGTCTRGGRPKVAERPRATAPHVTHRAAPRPRRAWGPKGARGRESQRPGPAPRARDARSSLRLGGPRGGAGERAAPGRLVRRLAARGPAGQPGE